MQQIHDKRNVLTCPFESVFSSAKNSALKVLFSKDTRTSSSTARAYILAKIICC